MRTLGPAGSHHVPLASAADVSPLSIVPDVHNVLALIGADDVDRDADAVVVCASALAQRTHSRLTLAVIPHRAVSAWLAGLAVASGLLPPPSQSAALMAERRLLRLARSVPPTIGLITLVLTETLNDLLARARYDVVLAGMRIATGGALAHVAIPVLAVPAVPVASHTTDAAGPDLARSGCGRVPARATSPPEPGGAAT